MITVTFNFETPDQAKTFLAGLGKRSLSALPEPDAERADVGPAPTIKVETPAPVVPVPPPANVPVSPTIPPAGPAAPDTPIELPPAASTAPVADQAALIQAFTALGNAKGKDGIVEICAHFGASQVLGPAGLAIPQEKWGEAIAAAQAAAK